VASDVKNRLLIVKSRIHARECQQYKKRRKQSKEKSSFPPKIINRAAEIFNQTRFKTQKDERLI
jgi:hypothetical protein